MYPKRGRESKPLCDHTEKTKDVMNTMHTDTSPRNAGSLAERLVARCARPMGERELERGVLHIADWCGIALAAVDDPSVHAIRSAVLASAGTGPCVAIAGGSLPPESAAFCNGALGTILEMDDLHRASIMHAGDVVIPAALAAAQFSNASGRHLIEAIVMGYEVALQLGSAAASGGYTPWYNSAVCGVFGAAIAATHAAGGDGRAKTDALGQAGMQAAGVWQCRLEDTDSKAVATAHAARAGVTSALLALHSVRGAREILEGPLGFFASYYPNVLTSRIVADRPDTWMLHEISFKPWPACRHVHPAVGVALQLRSGMDLERIEKVTIETYEAALDFCDNQHPKTDHEARFSLQHCVAVALLTGDLRLQDAGQGRRDDPIVVNLRDKTEVSHAYEMTAKFPESMGARVEIVDTAAAVHALSSQHALGDPEHPMSDEALERKFRLNVRSADVPDQVSAGLFNAISTLPKASDLRQLTAALKEVARPRQRSHVGGEAHGRYH